MSVTRDVWPADRWAVVIPVKHLASAKSRLGRDDLAWPFLRDCVAALQSCTAIELIAVATSDAEVATWATGAGLHVVSDKGCLGINDAIATAMTTLRLDRPRLPIMALVSDLPCLTPEAVDLLADLASGHATSFLADAEGTGTTAWCSAGVTESTPRFGIESHQAHVASGALDLVAHCTQDQASTLAPARRDVDTPRDLQEAIRMGTGPATTAALRTQTSP